MGSLIDHRKDFGSLTELGAIAGFGAEEWHDLTHIIKGAPWLLC